MCTVYIIYMIFYKSNATIETSEQIPTFPWIYSIIDFKWRGCPYTKLLMISTVGAIINEWIEIVALFSI